MKKAPYVSYKSYFVHFQQFNFLLEHHFSKKQYDVGFGVLTTSYRFLPLILLAFNI
ncbi:MAG: hypothetical protein K9G41_09785 [Flavobacteriales bacterium]|nr:hypothetical protein [Flavobacteriales bacterium]